jgi:prefoldin subunit 5
MKEKNKFVYGFLDIIMKVMDNRIDDQELINRLKGAIEFIKKNEEEVETNNNPINEDIKRVFCYWQRASGRHKAQLSPMRRQKIKARLGDFTVKQLCAVIDWSQIDPFHQGDNTQGTRYDTIETLFKTYEKVERIIEEYGETIDRSKGNNNGEIKKLEEKARKAMEINETEKYNEIQMAIKKLRKTG